MGKKNTIRFGVGTPDEPFSGLWRLVTNGNDVYLGASGFSMGLFKISLHHSGVWVFAATQQSGIIFDNGNRRLKNWKRPLEHAKGVTRGPSILVPRTSLGSRKISPNEMTKKAFWFESPAQGEYVEFCIYFVKKNASTNWSPAEIEVANIGLKNGDRVILRALKNKSPKEFLASCEQQLSENVVGGNPDSFFDASFLWCTNSNDLHSIPVIVDLPIPCK